MRGIQTGQGHYEDGWYLRTSGQAPLLVRDMGVYGAIQPLRLLSLPLAALQQNLLACRKTQEVESTVPCSICRGCVIYL